MQSKTSLLSKAIINNTIKRYYWMGALYFIALLFIVPLNILMNLPTEDHRYISIARIFNFGDAFFQTVILVTVPVLFGVLLFHYLQNKNSSDMIHSLPIKRDKLFFNHVTMGILFLTLPVVIVAIISFFIKIMYNLEAYYTTMDIIRWAGTTILINILLFMSSVFVGIVTGLSIVQGILTYIVMFLPTGLMVLVSLNLDGILYGFSSDYYMSESILKLSPIVKVFELPHFPLTWKTVVGYIILTAIMYILGNFLYKKRKLEKSMHVIVFTTLHHLFKYGVTFCFMLLGGLYIYATRGGLYWVLFGYVIFSFLGFCIAEGILQKSVRIFNKETFKYYLAYLVTIGILFLGISFDITGYQGRIPQIDEIKGVYFENGFYRSNSELKNNNIYVSNENIKLVQEIHKMVLKEGNKQKFKQKSYGYNERNISVAYHLKNGKIIARNYVIDLSLYQDLVKPLHESMESKLMRYDILKIDPSLAKRITINPNEGNYRKTVTIAKPEEIKEAMEILRQEFMKASYEELNDTRAAWGYISVLLEKDSFEDMYGNKPSEINLSWHKSFVLFESWLEKKGYLENARIQSNDIHYIVVEKVESQEEINKFERNEPIGKIKRLESYDKSEIELTLKNYSPYWTYTKFPKYIIGFYNDKKQQMFMGVFEEKYVPQFVKEFYKE